MLDTIAAVMLDVVEVTGDDVHLTLGSNDDGGYVAALGSPIWGSRFATLYDPVNGEKALAATGGTPAAALAALADLLKSITG